MRYLPRRLPPHAAYQPHASLPQVTVDVPDMKGRMEILNVHARNKKLAEDVDLETMALRTPGFSGADLANLLNEAAILAGRRGLQSISLKEVRGASGGGMAATNRRALLTWEPGQVAWLP